jgi:cytochrome c
MKKILFSALLLSGLAINAKAQDFPEEIKPLMTKYSCIACHKVDVKLVGPAYKDVAKKKYTVDKIVELIGAPKPANWPGYPPMAAMKVPKDDALKIAGWINSLAPKGKAKGKKS